MKVVPIYLVTDGNRLKVKIEIDGEWLIVIEEHWPGGGEISHIWEGDVAHAQFQAALARARAEGRTSGESRA